MPFFVGWRLTPYPTYGVTKPHSVVAPVSGSATGDFEVTNTGGFSGPWSEHPLRSFDAIHQQLPFFSRR
ncbi:hypothetical protein CEG88_07390 [Klebsiella aerogenes]|nr:hypothetical protein CEG88_07390 [Klebsiella aerogenes]